MRLYSRWQDSAGERVRIALNLKAVPYELKAVPYEVRRRRVARPRGVPASQPTGAHAGAARGDHVIAQSTAILEYLEETHPRPPLLPADLVLRAQARAFAQLIACDLHPINNNRARRYLSARMGASDEDVLAWYRHWVALALAALEAALADRPRDWPFCFGDAPGWADLHLVPQVANARRFGCDLSPYPRLLAADARCATLEAFRRARPEAQPDYPGAPN